jgi:transposase-like protein
MKKNTAAVGKVRAYRSKGLTFREIARVLKADIKTVYRWHGYSLTDDVGSSPVSVGDNEA